MGNLMNTLMGKENTALNDQVLANNMLAMDKAGAAGYLKAALESATPEIRRMYSEYLSTMMVSHEAIVQLALNRGWYTPYQSPVDQLENIYEQSRTVMEIQKQE